VNSKREKCAEREVSELNTVEIEITSIEKGHKSYFGDCNR